MRNPFRPNQCIFSPYGIVGVILTQNKIALVDEPTYNLVKSWRWYAAKVGRRWYAYSKTHSTKFIGRRRIPVSMHSIICPDFKQTDHRDGNGLNNIRKNLRQASTSQNAFNIPKYGLSSKYHGVTKSTHGGWLARIQRDGKRVSLGIYPTEELAHKARIRAEHKLYPEFDRVDR